MRHFRRQVRWEQLVFWRSREAAVFVFLFPLLLFALLTAVYNGTIYGRPASWALLAGMLGYGAATTAFAGPGSPPLPSISTPASCTTTDAPRAASPLA